MATHPLQSAESSLHLFLQDTTASLPATTPTPVLFEVQLNRASANPAPTTSIVTFANPTASMCWFCASVCLCQHSLLAWNQRFNDRVEPQSAAKLVGGNDFDEVLLALGHQSGKYQVGEDSSNLLLQAFAQMYHPGNLDILMTEQSPEEQFFGTLLVQGFERQSHLSRLMVTEVTSKQSILAQCCPMIGEERSTNDLLSVWKFDFPMALLFLP